MGRENVEKGKATVATAPAVVVVKDKKDCKPPVSKKAKEDMPGLSSKEEPQVGKSTRFCRLRPGHLMVGFLCSRLLTSE